jgi:tetratricopeptide (TPR) repeat protein
MLACRRIAALTVGLSLLTAAGSPAETVAATVKGLLATYHEDLGRLDRARDRLEAELARDRQVELMILLARVYFLVGEVRAASDDDRLAAYARGREVGQRAVELAPRSEEAHLWYAMNTGRWGQVKGVTRSMFLLPTLREEIDIIFTLNPRSVRGHALAGNVLFELPALLGGDRGKAEEHYRKGLQVDPHFTVLRVDLARLLIETGRHAEARRELDRVVSETRPSSLADWTVKDLPRARELLASIRDRK